MNKTAFVTGAAGFLGRHVVTELLSQGWRVTILLRGQAPDWLARMPVRVVQGHLEQLADIQNALPPATDTLFHLAGNISMWRGDRQAIDRDNIVATRNLIQVAQSLPVRRFVMTSTLGIFNTHNGPVTEDSPFTKDDSTNPYLHSKLVADRLLTNAVHQGLSAVSLHPSHLLGAHDRAGWIMLFDQARASKLRAAPKGRAHFCSAREVAQAHLAAAMHPHPHRRYVLGGAEASYQTLFTAIAQRVGAKAVTRTVPDAILQGVARISQWRSALTGVKPQMTPGLAGILTSQMLANSHMAMAELGYATSTLDELLDEAYADWVKRVQYAAPH